MFQMHSALGVRAASVSSDEVRRLERTCAGHQTTAVLEVGANYSQDKIRPLRPAPINTHQRHFKTVVSSRRKFSANLGQIEAIAAVIVLEWYLRKASNQSMWRLFQLDA